MNTSGNSSVRIAIFFWEGYLSVAPSLINALNLLSNDGFAVDVILRATREQYANIPVLPSQVRVLECYPLSFRIKNILRHLGLKANQTDEISTSNNFEALTGKQRLFKALRNSSLKTFSDDVFLLIDFIQFLSFSFTKTINHHYRAFFGIDIYGLIVSKIVQQLRMEKPILLYWSLEIYFLCDMRTWVQRSFKRLESTISRSAKFVLIQDHYRAESLGHENHLRADVFIFIPNAPIGIFQGGKHQYFHEKFELHPDVRIVLQAGMIDPAVMALEIASASNSWSSSYVLVLHDRMKRNITEPYIKEIRDISQEHVFLSLIPVPIDELDNIISSGDVGLVFYRPELGPNFSQIASASGKLAYYLRCGLPVICLDLPGMREIVEVYQCGICVQTVDEIASALNKIFDNYTSYSKNALVCYLERYEFGRYFQRILHEVHQAAKQ